MIIDGSNIEMKIMTLFPLSLVDRVPKKRASLWLFDMAGGPFASIMLDFASVFQFQSDNL